MVVELFKGKYRVRFIIFLILFIFSIISAIIYLTIGQLGKDDMLVVLSGEFLKWNINLPINKIPIRDVSNYYSNFYVYFGLFRGAVVFRPRAYIDPVRSAANLSSSTLTPLPCAYNYTLGA